MRAHSMTCLALSAGLAAGPVAAAAGETVADCPEFKTGWSTALQGIEPGRPSLVFQPRAGGKDGAERVSNLAEVEARLTCLEGKVSRVEVTQLAGGAVGATIEQFLKVSAAVLRAFDPDLGPGPAAELVAAMRAEAGAGRPATSAWGPYEITYGRKPDGARDEFVVDMAEN